MKLKQISSRRCEGGMILRTDVAFSRWIEILILCTKKWIVPLWTLHWMYFQLRLLMKRFVDWKYQGYPVISDLDRRCTNKWAIFWSPRISFQFRLLITDIVVFWYLWRLAFSLAIAAAHGYFDVPDKWETAKVSGKLNSLTKAWTHFQEIMDIPSGRLPSLRLVPGGSEIAETSAHFETILIFFNNGVYHSVCHVFDSVIGNDYKDLHSDGQFYMCLRMMNWSLELSTS